MKLETVIIITKGFCLATIPMVSTFGGGLSMLNGVTSIAGIPIQVLQLLCAAYTAGAGGLLAFLSQSFGDFLAGRQAKDLPANPPAVLNGGQQTQKTSQ